MGDRAASTARCDGARATRRTFLAAPCARAFNLTTMGGRHAVKRDIARGSAWRLFRIRAGDVDGHGYRRWIRCRSTGVVDRSNVALRYRDVWGALQIVDHHVEPFSLQVADCGTDGFGAGRREDQIGCGDGRGGNRRGGRSRGNQPRREVLRLQVNVDDSSFLRCKRARVPQLASRRPPGVISNRTQSGRKTFR